MNPRFTLGGGGGSSENRAVVHILKNIFMVACFIHFPLGLEKLYMINPNFIDFLCKSHGFENLIHLFRGPHKLEKKNN